MRILFLIFSFCAFKFNPFRQKIGWYRGSWKLTAFVPFLGRGSYFFERMFFMKEQLRAISERAANALKEVKAQSELEELRVAFLGKKGRAHLYS